MTETVSKFENRKAATLAPSSHTPTADSPAEVPGTGYAVLPKGNDRLGQWSRKEDDALFRLAEVERDGMKLLTALEAVGGYWRTAGSVALRLRAAGSLVDTLPELFRSLENIRRDATKLRKLRIQNEALRLKNGAELPEWISHTTAVKIMGPKGTTRLQPLERRLDRQTGLMVLRSAEVVARRKRYEEFARDAGQELSDMVIPPKVLPEELDRLILESLAAGPKGTAHLSDIGHTTDKRIRRRLESLVAAGKVVGYFERHGVTTTWALPGYRAPEKKQKAAPVKVAKDPPIEWIRPAKANNNNNGHANGTNGKPAKSMADSIAAVQRACADGVITEDEMVAKIRKLVGGV